MAHLVENMFSVRQVPWHGLGKIVQEAPDVQTAIELAGLNWQVLEQQVYNYSAVDNSHQRVPNYKALTRSDNGKVLAIMKDLYQPLQNSEAFNFFNPFVESGLASFETAGSLKEGRIIWILATLNKAPIEVGKNDIVQKYLLLSNSHDGTMAVRVGFTPTRVVCNNTLTMAHGNSESKLLRIRHHSNVTGRLDQISEIVNAMDAKFEATAEQYRHLAHKNISQKDLLKYVDVVFELNIAGNDREVTRTKKMRETIVSLFENGAGAHLKTAKGTWWGAYNAVTEHLTHNLNGSNESNLQKNWFGSKQRMNKDAFDIAMKAI